MQQDKTNKILSFFTFLLVQDLFNAPATEQEVQTLFERLGDPIGYISPKQILATAHPQGRISQVLAQRGWHGMGLRSLGVHVAPALHS